MSSKQSEDECDYIPFSEPIQSDAKYISLIILTISRFLL